MKKKPFLILAGVFTAVVVVLTIIAIVRYEKPGPDISFEPLRLCVTPPPTPHMQGRVDTIGNRWAYNGEPLVEIVDLDCDAKVFFVDEPAPADESGWPPGVATWDSAGHPIAKLWQDSWQGGWAGAGQFVLDHEVGHLLCIDHSTNDSSIMRPTLWGAPDDAAPVPAMILKGDLQEAAEFRSQGCIGPALDEGQEVR